MVYMMEWSVSAFFVNLESASYQWGELIVMIIGIVMIIAGLFLAAKGLILGNKSQINWFFTIALIILGLAVTFSGGWGLIKTVSSGGVQTIEDLGGGASSVNSNAQTLNELGTGMSQ